MLSAGILILTVPHALPSKGERKLGPLFPSVLGQEGVRLIFYREEEILITSVENKSNFCN